VTDTGKPTSWAVNGHPRRGEKLEAWETNFFRGQLPSFKREGTFVTACSERNALLAVRGFDEQVQFEYCAHKYVQVAPAPADGDEVYLVRPRVPNADDA
jgi:hypothetical protein